MALIINTNLAAMNIGRQYSATSRQLSAAYQHLSSGLRVNSAKDDAAGLAVSEGLKAKVKGNSQAVRNANDAISLAQTAEGALGQIAGNLQRIREIAVQASNGSISGTNRGQLQKEVDQLTQEISRAIKTTQFNGTSLLSGAGDLTFQIGDSGNATNQIAITKTDLTAGAANPVKLAADAIVASLVPPDNSYDALCNAAFEARSAPGVDFSATTYMIGQDGTSTSANIVSSTPESDAVRDTLNAMIAVYVAGGGYDGGVTTLDLQNAGNLYIATHFSGGGSPAFNSYNTNLVATSTVDITSQGQAKGALARIDADLASISDLRATFGAVQNRFEAVVSNLHNYIENLSAANSRIIDTDYSHEVAELTKGQILQQAGTSLLVQANMMPRTALALLR